MRVIGLRAEPKGFFWAVSEGTQELPILVQSGRVEAPKLYPFPESANYLRTRLLQTIGENKATTAALRTPEVVRMQTESFRERLRIEGVLLATCVEAGVIVTQGPLATLSRLLGVKSAKTLLQSDEFHGIDLERMPDAKREAILMSVSMLEGE